MRLGGQVNAQILWFMLHRRKWMFVSSIKIGYGDVSMLVSAVDVWKGVGCERRICDGILPEIVVPETIPALDA